MTVIHDTRVITLTRAEVEALKPCSLAKLDVFKDRDRLNAREALEAGASISDLLWVAGRLGLKREIVRFAVACAERVAHLNPDPRVQAALDAARAWLGDPSEDKRAVASSAAYDADAAGVAYAAAYDAYAADAAHAASEACTTAAAVDPHIYAYAAAGYAARAANAAEAAEREAQRDIFISIFCPEDGQ